MAKRRKIWIKKAIKRPGALRAKAKKAGALMDGISTTWLRKRLATLRKKKTRTAAETRTMRQIILALRLRKLPKRGKK